MNRLKLALVASARTKLSRLFGSLLVTALIATPQATAQFQSSPVSPNASQNAGNAFPAPALSVEQAQSILQRLHLSLENRDYTQAVQAYRSLGPANRLPVAIESQVLSARQQLIGKGIDQALLDLPLTMGTPGASDPSLQRDAGKLGNSGPTRLSPLLGFDAAKPLSSVAAEPHPMLHADTSTRKKEVLRLLAIGRAALDRGDVSNALLNAQTAKSLNVPEREFAAGQPRVWSLLIDAESAAKRSGIATVSATSPIGSPPTTGVQTAFGTTATSPNQNAIAQMLFTGDPNAGVSTESGLPNGTAIEQVQNTEPMVTSTQGARAYEIGMTALTAGNRREARKQFLEAWRLKEELTVAQQNQLKDKLTLMQPTRLVAPSKTNSKEISAIDKSQLEAESLTRRLYGEVTSELAKAEKIKTERPLDSLDELNRLLRRIDSSDVDAAAKRSLAQMVKRTIANQKSYIDSNRAKIDLDIRNDSIKAEMTREDKQEAQIDAEVSQLVEEFNQFMHERRYSEAEIIAKQVGDLKPDSPISVSMFHGSRMGVRLEMNKEIDALQEDHFARMMLDVERSSIGQDPDNPMTLPDADVWSNRSIIRLNSRRDGNSNYTAAEQAILKHLTDPVSVNFKNRPLGEVMSDLSAMSNIPIIIDERMIHDVKVTTETPVSLQLPDAIALKSALNIMLDQLNLAYMIDNDVLTITTREAKEANVETRTYRVTDLVTPIPNFISSYEDGLAGALRAAYQATRPQADVQLIPVSATDINRRMGSSMMPMSNPSVLGQYHPMGGQGGFGVGGPAAKGMGGGSSFADFSSLIELIQTTVNPDTWQDAGGESTISEYAQNLSLVISTTSETHDEIQQLLESLRRLQNLQITIEVRFITLSDTFAEQIGVDFDFQIDDNTTALPDEDNGDAVTIGFNGQGFTPDLDISFSNTSFLATPPAFGGANLGEASSLGFAILSDIEAFFFIQAIQTDNRTNVMQAPKVTLFDGQIATISDQSQRPFVTSVTPVVGDFAVAQQPVIVVLNEGTSLNVQGIVSDDKRFVRLTLVPFFSQIGDVNTFTYEGRRSTRNSSRNQEDTNGDGVVDDRDAVDSEDSEDIIEGTTVQLPTFAFTTVSTTVSVPDGGTILLGGIKRMNESRSERGVPMLSKIPYLSRLFRNVTVGRDARSLMLMVTPRIIIQEEEELAQTGFDPTRR